MAWGDSDDQLIMQVTQQSTEPGEISKWGESAPHSFWGATKPSAVMEPSQQKFLRRAKFIQVAGGACGHELQGKKYKWGTTYMPGRETRKDGTHGWWITAAKEGNLINADQEQLFSCVNYSVWGVGMGEILFNWDTWAILEI